MSSQLIAPVNPSLTRPAVRGGGRTGQARRLPLAIVAEVPALADDVLYGVGRIDASGRVGDRAFTSALGWRPGDRLTLTAADGVVIARRDPGAGPRYCGDPLYSSLAAAGFIPAGQALIFFGLTRSQCCAYSLPVARRPGIEPA
jgi:hypothetical protein